MIVPGWQEARVGIVLVEDGWGIRREGDGSPERGGSSESGSLSKPVGEGDE